MGEQKNFFLAVILSILVLSLWHFLYEVPQLEEQQRLAQERRELQASFEDSNLGRESKQKVIFTERKVAIAHNQRVQISNPKLHGSISLQGARFDDITLIKYKEDLSPDSDEVSLLSPSDTHESYFVELGWLGKNIDLPDANSLWSTTSSLLSVDKPITLTWVNAQGIKFMIDVALDENYLFNIKQRVQNDSGSEIKVTPFGRISRLVDNSNKNYAILHEGPITINENALEEIKYADIKKKNKITFDNYNSWIGFSDKYWLSAIIPDKRFLTKYRALYTGEFDDLNRYQLDFIGQSLSIAVGEGDKVEHKLFVGAKELKILDKYMEVYDIPLFDRAVDLGMLYFLTKPLLFVLQSINLMTGNFGFAIILLTILIKAIMFPLAHKSYTGMAQMKKIQPRILEIKERYAGDATERNKAIMKLYKDERVNPASGCLPILIQIPVFFALYKVLFVTIEMRHAPFIGWIKDLSEADHTSIFNLFGLLPFTPPTFLPELGVLPLLVGITMIFQQKFNPTPADPVQAQVMKLLPYMFIFIFAGFPAGLLVYWTVNNLLSILQQWIITNKLAEKNG